MLYNLIYLLQLLASKDTQKYFCPAHPNNLEEKYQQIRLIRFCTIWSSPDRRSIFWHPL